MFTILYTGVLAAILGGSLYLSFSGSGLPGPEEGKKISLKEGSRGGATRRSHYYGGYIGGK